MIVEARVTFRPWQSLLSWFDVPAMINLDVDMSRWRRRAPESLDQIIESLCRAHGLSITMKATLSKYPGSIHWHLKRGRERGTLEVTLCPREYRLWFSMQDGRRAEWVMESARRIKEELEEDTGQSCLPESK
jgi:hypothetical protein